MNPERKQHLKQKAKREHREQVQQNHFTQPLTGPRARHIAKAEANNAYNETQRQNAGLIRASANQQKTVGGWYDHFANEIAASRGEVAGAYDKANAAIAGNIQTAGADNTARNAALADQDAKFAQLTGGPANTAGPRVDAAAQGQRDLYGGALAAPVAAQGANSFAYLTNERNTAKGEGIYQRVQERKRRQSLQQDRKALLKEKGQYRVSKLDELRKDDRDYKIQRAGVGLDKASAKADAAQAQRDAQQQREENQEDNAQDERGSIRSSGGSGGGPTSSEKRDARQGRHAALQRTREFVKAHGYPKGPEAHAELVEKIEAGEGIGAQEARWAVKKILAQAKKSRPKPGGKTAGEKAGEAAGDISK